METILIFAGGDSPTASLWDELPEPDLIIAADSGYDLADRAGFTVDVLVGDMDSIETEVIPDSVIQERHPTDKDATDLELALARATDEEPLRIVVVGGGGARLDHELATAALLCSERWADVEELDWVTDRGTAYVVRSRRIIHGDPGAIFTLIPMGGPVTGVNTRGLRWNLMDATMHPGTTWGVSNELTGPVADIRVATGCLLVVMPSGVPG
jgi:thiamine pyrophosphokinase